MKGLIGDIPWGIGYRSEKFGLVSLNDSYVGIEKVDGYIQLVYYGRHSALFYSSFVHLHTDTAHCTSKC